MAPVTQYSMTAVRSSSQETALDVALSRSSSGTSTIQAARPTGESVRPYASVSVRALDPLVAHFFREPVLHLRLVLRLGGGGLSGLAEVAEQPQEVQMDAVQVLGIRGREPGGHLGPDIALGTEAGVAEHVCHQGGKQVGHRHPVEPRLLGAKGNAYPGRDGATTVKASRVSPHNGRGRSRAV